VAPNELINLRQEPKGDGARGKVCSQIPIMTLGETANLRVVSVCDESRGRKLPQFLHWAQAPE